VSPRSAELLARAHDGLASARLLLEPGRAATTVSIAYFAMLYAARAALSERDRYARSHRETWGAFYEEFVVTGAFDADLLRDAQRAQARREASDYGAAVFELSEAQELLATAHSFVEAVERLTG